MGQCNPLLLITGINGKEKDHPHQVLLLRGPDQPKHKPNFEGEQEAGD